MKKIVKYHNDLNKIKMPNFSELQQNLFYTIILKITEKLEAKRKSGEDAGTEYENHIVLLPNDLRGFSEKNLINRETTQILYDFERNLFQADFEILVKNEKQNLIGKMRAHLFNYFVIWADCKGNFDIPTGTYEAWKEFTHIELGINEHFEYLVSRLAGNFTAFEIKEFISIIGKYSKAIYRLLKQYRSTGRAEFKWDDFTDLIDVPKKYKMRDIDNWILKPAIAELTRPRGLFDQERIPFENLTYTKIKGKGRGRGGKVVGITFTFKPQRKALKPAENTQNPQQPSAIPAPQGYVFTSDDLCELKRHKERTYSNDNSESIKITEITKSKLATGGENIVLTWENRETGDKFKSPELTSMAHFENYIKSFTRI